MMKEGPYGNTTVVSVKAGCELTVGIRPFILIAWTASRMEKRSTSLSEFMGEGKSDFHIGFIIRCNIQPTLGDFSHSFCHTVPCG